MATEIPAGPSRNREDIPTPRTDAAIDATEPSNIREVNMMILARELERDLETCRDAHMANCLAADTLRTEIRAIRELYARESVGRRSETATNELDGARYRYLRDHRNSGSGLFVGIKTAGGISQVTLTNADKLIDRAMEVLASGERPEGKSA